MKIPSKAFKVLVVLQFGLRILYIVIHVIWNLYAGKGVWGVLIFIGSPYDNGIVQCGTCASAE